MKNVKNNYWYYRKYCGFKSIQLISDLVKQDIRLKSMMSKYYTFVTPVCIQSLTKRKVYVDTFDDENPAIITHIDIIKMLTYLWLSLPATYDCKTGIYGMADNIYSKCFLVATCPKLIAPAMNVLCMKIQSHKRTCSY